jgi:hypothetical protein
MITIACFLREGKGIGLAYLASLFRKKNNSIPSGFLSFTRSMITGVYSKLFRMIYYCGFIDLFNLQWKNKKEL